MNAPKNLKYAKSHEWVLVDGDVATIGISDFAQDSLGDVVFFDAPEEGDSFEKGETFGEVESVKAVSEVYAPISGEVVAVNEALEDAPETVNESPYGQGWMIKVKILDASELDSLLDSDSYVAECE